MTSTRLVRLFSPGLILASLAVWGCSSQPPRLHPPEIDASAAGKAAIQQYDTNSDGTIGGDELAQAPELQASMNTVDTNSDGTITADEITSRIEQWQQSKLGRTSMTVGVQYRGQPLEGATVTLEPAAFLGENVKPASATTDSTGMAFPSIPTDPNDMHDPPGVAPGFYRVKISKQVNGQEAIPPAYNEQTQYGVEIALDSEVVMEGLTMNIQ